ncbi:type IV pilus secretin PilQ [Desulfocurvibacter africanus]|uniref:type IV pilus secretin PilQ n=1 Tax=Desulfocurvibacter africanus TaxID=873 RepID=UPI002FDB686F
MTTVNRALDLLPGCPAMLTLLVLLALVAGCADKKPEPDPFFSKWQTMAQESRGHSPSPKPHAPEITDIGSEGASAKPATVQRSLPDTLVTLRLRDTEVSAVLRALGRLAKVNLLLSPGVQGKANLDVRNASWSQVFEGLLKSHGLTWAWQGQVLRVISAEDLQREASVSNAMGGNLALRQTSVVAVRYADAAKLKENLQPLMTTGPTGQPMGTLVVDEHNNALIIQAAPEESRRILRLVEQLDKPRAQILLKAHIVETTKDTARDLGVQWGGVYQTSGSGNNLFAIPGGTNGRLEDNKWVYDSTLGSGIGGQGFGVNLPADLTAGGTQLGLMFGKLGGNILELQLSALQENGRVNILSSPSISTLDNQMAFTENGERVPYVATDPEGELNVMFEDAVLRLEITPHVIDREQLKLKILVRKDEVDTSRTVQGNPFIIKKRTETVLVVDDGETVVISGLSRDFDSSRDQKVPWLGDIPLLGRLFQRNVDKAEMEEVLIFITPHVLPFRAAAAPAGAPAAGKAQRMR